MKGRKWEDLEFDCLVNVLKRVGMESLLLDVPFVCKSWYKASFNPSCWEQLVFPQGRSYDRFTGRFMHVYKMESLPEAAFIKFIIDRSCKHATVLSLPDSSTDEELKYAANECPALRILALPSDLLYDQSMIIPELIGKWKNLTGLKLGNSYNLTKILPEISLNCKNFESLYVGRASIGEDEAMSIVTNFPRIKHLFLKGAYLCHDNLVKILQGCKELVLLDVRDCIGYEANDKLIELASHVRKFMHEGSKLEEIQDDYDDFYGDPASFYHYDGYCSDY